jgi:hypothetical protein
MKAPSALRLLQAACRQPQARNFVARSPERLEAILADFQEQARTLRDAVANGSVTRLQVKLGLAAFTNAYATAYQDRIAHLAARDIASKVKSDRAFIQGFSPRLSRIRLTIAKTRGRMDEPYMMEMAIVATAFLPYLILIEDARAFTYRTRPTKPDACKEGEENLPW